MKHTADVPPEKAPLFLNFTGIKKAKIACKRWHYTRSCPNAAVTLAVYEDGQFIGIVQFGSGNTHIGSPYKLDNSVCRELVRVALSRHKTHVSRIIAIALRLLKRRCPQLRLIVSYADASQGHYGGIYQAGGWIYVGPAASHTYRVKGRNVHGRTLYSRYGPGSQQVKWLRKHVDPRAARVKLLCKHKYLYPLDDGLRTDLQGLSKPYPKPEKSKRAPLA